MKKSYGRKGKRWFALFICLCLIGTTTPVTARAENGKTGDILYVSGFAELPEEVRGQTVSVGTDLKDLTLPTELTVSLAEDENITETEPESGTELEEGTEPENGTETDTESGTEPENKTETETEHTVPAKTDESGEADEPAKSDAADEDTDVKETDAAEQTANSDNNNDADSDNDETGQKTHTVTMPEYNAENVIIVEILEADTTQEESATIRGITWQSEPEYDKNAEGKYIFTAVLPEGYALAEGVSLPLITVTVQEESTDDAVQALIDRIAALPDSEEYLAGEPDTGEEDAYEEWMEGLYGYAEEALAILEEYEALVKEQQEKIPKEMSARLTAWTELAKLLAPSMVLAADSALPKSCAFTVTGGVYETDYKYEDKTLKILTDTAITISGKGGATTDTIFVESGVSANVTLQNVNIDLSGQYNAAAFKIADNSAGNVTVTLSGVNTLKSGTDCAGLQKNGSKNVGKLTIQGNGSLTASSRKCGAGIGGGYGSSCSNITISGGTVTASCIDMGAGIGGGYEGAGSNITISGGTVTATGNYGAAGIGGGYKGAGSNITISGGTVIATGGEYGAGIGGGYERVGSNITISGGTVTATGGEHGAGIGGGYEGAGSNITISGSNTVVCAKGGSGAENIGSGNNKNSTSASANRNGGLIIEGNTGKIYGDVELRSNFTIGNGVTLNIDDDTSKSSTLTVAENVRLTNKGTIDIESGDKLIVNGTLVNNGTIENNGTIGNSGSISGSGTISGNQPVTLPIPISGVAISITAPTAGTQLDTSPSCSTTGVKALTVTYSTGSETVDGAALYNQTYTATFELEPEDNYAFTSGISASDVTVNGSQAASVTLHDKKLTVTYTFPATAKAKLQKITSPTAITGVANGTAKTADALKLPKTVTIETEDTNVTSAAVTWDLDNLASGTYDPSVLTEQTFTVRGTVSLPEEVEYPDNISLETTVQVTVSAHMHTLVKHEAAAAACTVAGTGEYWTCESCNKMFQDAGGTTEITEIPIIAATGHTWGAWRITAEPTLTATGTAERVCTKNSDHKDTITLPVLTDTAVWTEGAKVEPTENADGSQEYTSDYGTVTIIIPALGHTHSVAETVSEKAATCTEDGNTAYYICSCGKWFSDNACTNEITDHAGVIVEKLGHSFSGRYLFDGNGHWKVCSRCNVPQTPESHIFDDNNDTTCNKCDYQRTIETHTHSAAETVSEKAATCTEDGNTAYYICSCGKWFSDNACTNEIADHAGVIVEKLGHSFSGRYLFDENGHWKVCSRCNIPQTPESHVFDDNNDTTCNKCDYQRTIETHTHSVARTVEAKEAACTTAGNSAYYICTCGKWFSDSACTREVTEQDVTIAAKGHDFSGSYQRDAKEHWKVCSRCGVKDTAHKHRYDNGRDAYCNDCNYKRKISSPGTDNKDKPDESSSPNEPGSTDNPNTMIYKITDGVNISWTLGSSEDITIRGNGDFAKFTGAKVDGVLLDKSSYGAKEGSTIITLKAAYLNTLRTGTHTIEILWTDGSAVSMFTVNAKSSDNNSSMPNNNDAGQKNHEKDNEPKTGDNTPLELYATLAMIAGFTYLLFYFTERRHGMTEETKKELVARLVRWEKQGGRIRKCLAFAVIFVLLVYYHGIGKKTCAEWKEIYGE